MIATTRTEVKEPVKRKVHDVKLLAQYVKPVASGKKPFEIRYNDRGYQVGDKLILNGWDKEKNEYTGEIIDCLITYVLRGGQFGLESRYVALGIKVLGANF